MPIPVLYLFHAGGGGIILSAAKADIAGYICEGNNLVIEFVDGRRIDVENFFTDNHGHNLVLKEGEDLFSVNLDQLLAGHGVSVAGASVAYSAVTNTGATTALLGVLGVVAVGGIAVAAGGSSSNNGAGGTNIGVLPPNSNTSLAVSIDNAFARGADSADIAVVFAEIFAGSFQNSTFAAAFADRVAFAITNGTHPNYSNVHNTIKAALANAISEGADEATIASLVTGILAAGIVDALNQGLPKSTVANNIAIAYEQIIAGSNVNLNIDDLINDINHIVGGHGSGIIPAPIMPSGGGDAMLTASISGAFARGADSADIAAVFAKAFADSFTNPTFITAFTDYVSLAVTGGRQPNYTNVHKTIDVGLANAINNGADKAVMTRLATGILAGSIIDALNQGLPKSTVANNISIAYKQIIAESGVNIDIADLTNEFDNLFIAAGSVSVPVGSADYTVAVAEAIEDITGSDSYRQAIASGDLKTIAAETKNLAIAMTNAIGATDASRLINDFDFVAVVDVIENMMASDAYQQAMASGDLKTMMAATKDFSIAITDAIGATDASKLIGDLDFDAIAEAMEQMVAIATNFLSEEDNPDLLTLSANAPTIGELMSEQPISTADNDTSWGFIPPPPSSLPDDMSQPLVIV